MIRVLITDDQKHVRQGYCLLLRRELDLDIVGEARDGQDALDLAQRLEPDVITMDLRMPHMDGFEATRQLVARPRAPRVLVVAGSWEDEYVRQALDCGASGYVAKQDAFTELPGAIRETFRGNRYFSHQLSAWRSNGSTRPA